MGFTFSEIMIPLAGEVKKPSILGRAPEDHLLGLDYVSCPPFRVPIALLAPAHGAQLE